PSEVRSKDQDSKKYAEGRQVPCVQEAEGADENRRQQEKERPGTPESPGQRFAGKEEAEPESYRGQGEWDRHHVRMKIAKEEAKEGKLGYRVRVGRYAGGAPPPPEVRLFGRVPGVASEGFGEMGDADRAIESLRT